MTAQQSRPGSNPSLTRRTGGVRDTDLEIVRSVGVRRGAGDVFGYASDFARASEWRAEVVESTPRHPVRCASAPGCARWRSSPAAG